MHVGETALVIQNLLDLHGAQEAKKASFSALFDSQIRTLGNNVSEEVNIDLLRLQKSAVIERASGIAMRDGNIPFLPIVPGAIFGGVFHRIEVNIDPIRVDEPSSIPATPYYIFDVEVGKITFGKDPCEAARILLSESRTPLTIDEILALSAINHLPHGLWAGGSLYQGSCGDDAVRLCPTRVGQNSRVISSSSRIKNSEHGTPSCGSRR